MSSLMEELLDVLENEYAGYEELTGYAEEKKQAIIKSDLQLLEAVTIKEQECADRLKALENKRTRVLYDMSVVMGKDGGQLTVSALTEMLSKQPAEQEKLRKARQKLLSAAEKMHVANLQNEALIKQAMEMVEFDLTLLKGMRQAPETANYGRDAYSTGDILGGSGFDAKQ